MLNYSVAELRESLPEAVSYKIYYNIKRVAGGERNKELLIIPGASHCDLYDGGYSELEGKGQAKNIIPWEKMEEFFYKNMK